MEVKARQQDLAGIHFGEWRVNFWDPKFRSPQRLFLQFALMLIALCWGGGVSSDLPAPHTCPRMCIFCKLLVLAAPWHWRSLSAPPPHPHVERPQVSKTPRRGISLVMVTGFHLWLQGLWGQKLGLGPQDWPAWAFLHELASPMTPHLGVCGPHCRLI